MSTDINKLHSQQTEIDVIGALLFESYIYDYVADELQPELFFDYECRKAYEVVKEFIDEGKEPDFAEIGTRMSKHNVSITKFITDNMRTLELTKQRVVYLQELYLRRKLYSLFYKGEVMTSDPTITIEEVHALFKEFDAVMNHNKADDVQRFGDIITSLMNDVAERKNDKGDVGIMTGLHIFDSRFGWHGGDLIIIAGETSQGKSTLATTIAYNMAVNGVPSVFYSMEMSAKQLAARIIARQTKVSSSTTLYGKLNDQEYNQVYDGTLAMKNLPIYFDEDSKVSFTKICSSIRRMVKRLGVKVVFIDYLQILANGHGDNREQLIGDMARDLKRLAVETNTCICALSQLARSANGSKEPSLSRMRGSGQIEEACDMGVLIYRPNKSEAANIYLAKGRNIGLAKEKVKFDSALSYFCDYEEGDPQAPFQEQREKLPF